jgi:hypothetical protein
MGYAKGDPEAEGWVRGLIQGLVVDKDRIKGSAMREAAPRHPRETPFIRHTSTRHNAATQ